MGRLHPNVLKLRKQKRQGKRAWFQQYGGAIHVPRSVGKTSIPEDAQALFNYRDRAKGCFDPFLDAIFPQLHYPPPSDWPSQYVDPKFPEIVENVGERNGRRWALSRADEERLIDRVSQDDFCDFVTLSESIKLQTRLTYIFNRQKTKFFFVEVWYAKAASFIRISKEYGSRDRVLFDFGNFSTGHIHWQEVMPITSLEAILPIRK